jgi:hypothetical protein
MDKKDLIVKSAKDGVAGYYKTDNLFHFWTESIEL